nr:casein kinase [Pandoravirus massiliensis]
MHRRSGHQQQQRAHEAKRRAGADSGTANSTDDCGDAPYRTRHPNGSARIAKRQRNAAPSRRHSARRHVPSSSSSSSSSSTAALTPYAIEAGAAVAAAYPHAITPGEAAALVATMAAEGAAAAGDSSDSSDSLQPGTVVADRFALGRVAGSGGFGVVYEAVDMADPQRLRVAIKMEKGEHRVRSLRHEAVVFAALAGGPGVPPVLWSGSATAGDGKRVDVLVMPLLGVSLYDYMRSKSSGHLAPEAVMHIGRYILRYLEHMHARGWLHRDVKPHNFLLDRSRKTIYMVDYGLAKRWCDPRTGAHVEYERRRNRSSVPGTAKYASLNTHQGVGAFFPSFFSFFSFSSALFSLPLLWPRGSVCAACAVRAQRTRPKREGYKRTRQPLLPSLSLSLDSLK